MPHKPKRPGHPTVQSILQDAAQLDPEHLIELHHAIEALVDAIDADDESATDSGTQPRTLTGKRGGGYIEWKMINGYGPYPYLRLWVQGKRKSYYLRRLRIQRDSEER